MGNGLLTSSDRIAGIGRIAIAIAFGIGAWWETHSWWKTLLVSLGCALLAFSRKVWAELEPIWVKRIASWTDSRLIIGLARYRKRYARYLYYKHRTFDVKGLSNQGKFALEIESVYVDLTVDPAQIGEIGQGTIQAVPEGEEDGRRNVLSWLIASSSRQSNFAIVGPPGSGKTTLLKHLALVLAARKGPFKCTPVLLFLRDHAAGIGINPDIGLAQLIQESLRDLPPRPPGS